MVDNPSMLRRYPTEMEQVAFDPDPRSPEESRLWSDDREKIVSQCGQFWLPELDRCLLESIEQHGVFWAKPFWAEAKPIVQKVIRDHPLREDVLDPDNRWLGREWEGKRKRLSQGRIWSEVGFAFQLYACRRASQRPEMMSAYLHRLSEQSQYYCCVICGWTFRPCDLPGYLYMEDEDGTDFCHTCLMSMFSPGGKQGHQMRMFSESRPHMLDALSTLVELMGFVPPQDFRSVKTLRRAERERRPRVVMHLWKMRGLDEYQRKFGSWAETLIAADVLTDDCFPTGRGTRCFALDGHRCRSLEERQIDDWLYKAGIPHTTEPPYPPHPILNPDGLRLADWRVGDVLIEYWGLAGMKAYDERMKSKRELAKEVGISLIEIYPNDLYDLSQKLGCLRQPGYWDQTAGSPKL